MSLRFLYGKSFLGGVYPDLTQSVKLLKLHSVFYQEGSEHREKPSPFEHVWCLNSQRNTFRTPRIGRRYLRPLHGQPSFCLCCTKGIQV